MCSQARTVIGVWNRRKKRRLTEVIDRAQEIHLAACTAGSPDPVELAERLVEHALDSGHSVFHDALAESAGVPTVVEAIERSTRMRARQATGWPNASKTRFS